MKTYFIATAIVTAFASGVPALFLSSRHARYGQILASLGMVFAATMGLTGSALHFVSGQPEKLFIPWPVFSNPALGLDALSAFFLMPVFLIGALGSLYGLSYWPTRLKIASARTLPLFWGFLVSGMALLIYAQHALSFLLGWETMALAAFFLVVTDHQKADTRRSGLIYLIATHISTLTLIALFLFWQQTSGSFAFTPLARGVASSLDLHILFFLALVGFGLKAGIIPLHFWLPGAHANAPSHVSAIMSGVLIKMGIYGLFRILFLIPEPPFLWGNLLLILGAISSLVGVIFAIAQHDIKRLLAYHSIENIGIILMGMGMGLIGLSLQNSTWAVLGFAGALLHVWNHALFKSLLFFGAGIVVHGTHSREIDTMGGVAKRMPWTAAFFLLGAVAISGLPPLNGFVSELFIYLALFGSATSNLLPAMIVPVLAMTGALALACFVKVYGAVFLGSARSENAQKAHGPDWLMMTPLVTLGIASLGIGLLPALFAPLLDAVITQFLSPANLQGEALTGLTPLSWISAMGFGSLAAGFLVYLLLKRYKNKTQNAVTWDCGYSKPSATMQYTASSFAASIVLLFSWILRPRFFRHEIKKLFPDESHLHTHVDELVLDRIFEPMHRILKQISLWFHRFQQGSTQYYIAYILIVLLLMLASMLPFSEFSALTQ